MADDHDPASLSLTPLDEFLDRFLRGEAVDPRDFVDTHPELSEQERRQIQALGAGKDDGLRAGDPQAPEALPISRIGTYRLISRIGAGSSGAVYLAQDESLGRTVAVKILGPDLLGKGEREERFAREARAVASLRHRNIVTIHAAGEEAGVRYLAMEHVPGLGLDEVLEAAASEGSLPRVPDVVGWGIELASALDCAHSQGIVHRDVKPSNIRIAEDGRAVLLDFGIARAEGAATLTESGEFRGSPQYASPEQVGLADVAIDARSDVYSLGVTLYELLTGAAPFRAPTREQLFHQILGREPVAPRKLEPTVPRDLETIVLAMLEKDAAKRPQAAAVAADLEAFRQGRPIAIRPVSRLGRLTRWSKREPAKAVLTLCLVVGIPVIAALGGYIAANKPKIDKAAAAERAAQLAVILQNAYIEYGEGDPALAVPHFRDALEKEPGSSEAKAGYALAKSASGDPEGALAFLESDRSDGVEPAWRVFLRGKIQSDSRRPASETRPAEPATHVDHFVMAIVALDRFHQGNRNAAAQAYDRLLAATLTSPTPIALYYYEMGHAAWHAGRHKEARLIAAAIQRHWPGTPESAFAVGRMLFDADRETSYVALVEAARNPPRAPAAAVAIVRLLGDSGRDDIGAIAVDLGRKASARHPTDSAIRASLAAALRGRGEIDAAIAEAREGIRLNPRNGESHYRLAEAFVVKKDYAAALEPARTATRLQPWDSRVWNVLGVAVLEMGETDEAVKAYENSLELLPESPATLCNLGRALKRRGDFAEALEKLEAGDRIGSKDPRWKHPSKKWLSEVRQLLALEKRLDEIRNRRGINPTPAELALIARRVCIPKRRHAEAAALFERAFRDEPALLAQTSTDYVGEAVAAAATAGLGRGADAPQDAAGRARLLATARRWITDALEQKLETDEAATRPATPLLRVKAWLADPAVAATRIAGTFADEAEATEWRRLWQRLDQDLSR